MKPLIFFLCIAAWGQSTWTEQTITGTAPRAVLWTRDVYNPVSGKMLTWQSTVASTSIYSNSFWEWNHASNTFTAQETSGTTTATCPASTSTAPGDRHPRAQWLVDTKRNRLVMWGGVCLGSERSDMGYADLTANPRSWTYYNLSSKPDMCSGSKFLCYNRSYSSWYDPVVDAYFVIGYDGGPGNRGFGIFCPTDGNPTPGVLTSAQAAAGCGTAATIANFGVPIADGWVELSTWFGNGPTITGGTYPPVDTASPSVDYDPINNVAVLIGEHSVTSGTMETWTYNSATLTWTKLSPTDPPPFSAASESVSPTGNENGVAPFAYIGSGKFWYHPANSGARHDWTYTTATNTWTDLGDLGGPTDLESIIYIPTTGKLIAHAKTGATITSMWTITASSPITITIPLTVQETLFPGDPTGKTDTVGTGGVTRTNEPVLASVPLIKGVIACGGSGPGTCTGLSALKLTEPTVGQFRCLTVWEDNSCKILETITVVSLNAGATTTVTLTDGGSGNFGGSDLATDGGSTITVATGTSTFTLKKANHNGLDIVDVGATHLVLTGTSSGLVLLGPTGSASYPGNVTCLPDSGGTVCTTVYSSKYDASSTCSIEKNGPVQSVIKCTGTHKDSTSAYSYMSFTVRYFFTLNKNYVRVQVILRNANYGTSDTFATAYKGHKGYEFRTGVNISGTTNYTFACESGTSGCTTSPVTGTMSGSDSIYLYQAKSHYLKLSDECGGASGCVSPTTDNGYSLVKTVSGTPSTLASDSTYTTKASGYIGPGWTDIANGSGVGVEISTPFMSAWELKSLEFRSGGTEAVIGLLAPQNSIPQYQAWPAWNQFEAFLEFHTSALASPSNQFFKLQQPLISRASISQYNSTGVFPIFQLVDSTTENNWYTNTGASAAPSISAGYACCLTDYGWLTTSGSQNLDNYPWWAWSNGGATTQMEFRWSNLLKFLERGWTGRFLDSQFFYKHQAGWGYPMSDGFTWRTYTSEIDGYGNPSATSTNSAKAGRNWHDAEHHWTFGILTYYELTGEEWVKDSITTGMKDWYMNAGNVVQYQGLLWNRRANGGALTGYGRMYTFLTSIGDTTDATTLLNNGKNNYGVSVNQQLCLNGYPVGCSTGSNNQGVSRTRGATWGPNEYADVTPWCGVASSGTRINGSLQNSAIIHGILELRAAAGSGWSEYINSLDLAYGISKYAQSELFTLGNGRWSGTQGYPRAGYPGGSYYYPNLDLANGCDQAETNPLTEDSTYMNFLPDYLMTGNVNTWEPYLKIVWQRYMGNYGTGSVDMGDYQTANLISILANPGINTLQTQSITSFVDNGGGSYTIGWVNPSGTTATRGKWGTKIIVDWIGFDNQINTWVGNPATTQNWWASTEISSMSATVGYQTKTVSTGETGLTIANFSVKVMAPSNISKTSYRSGTNKVGGGIRK